MGWKRREIVVLGKLKGKDQISPSSLLQTNTVMRSIPTLHSYPFIIPLFNYQHYMFRIFIIGTTGVGKTKLSIQLAKHLKGQIISSDSKQLYRHASIMTAKVTEQQAEGVPHHMVDVLDLHQNAYNRNKFFSEAWACMQKIEEKGKVAITVGGTNYYTETLLYDLQALPIANDSESQEQGEKEKPLTEEEATKLQQLKSLSKQQRYQLLKEYDSLIAEKVHRNNQQKINLFLQRMILSNRKISDRYQSLTPKLRHDRTLVFWLRNSNKEELLGMITKRIHKMLDQAGITEIFSIYHYLHLHRAANEEGDVNYEQYSGAASSIGIKEFLNLYKQVREKLLQLIPKGNEAPSFPQIHSTISQHFEELEYSKQTLEKCTEQLILDTKHYCKRQITWIKNRMFLNSQAARQHFFVLDLQQHPQDQPMQILQRFQRQIRQKAVDIIQNIREHGFGHVLQQEGHFAQHKVVALQDWKKYYCQACKLEVNGEFDWNNHLNSKRHIKQVKYIEKKEEREQYIAQQKAQAELRRKLKGDGQQKIQKIEEK